MERVAAEGFSSAQLDWPLFGNFCNKICQEQTSKAVLV
jgi:hypothetical protein